VIRSLMADPSSLPSLIKRSRSAGGVDAVVDPGHQAAADDEMCVTVRQGDQLRVYAVGRGITGELVISW